MTYPSSRASIMRSTKLLDLYDLHDLYQARWILLCAFPIRTKLYGMNRAHALRIRAWPSAIKSTELHDLHDLTKLTELS